MPNIFDVADYILRKLDPATNKPPRQRQPMTSAKLQAMCYLAQAQHLVATGGTALFEQDFQAGPWRPISQELHVLINQYPAPDAIPQDMLTNTLTPEQTRIIDCIIARYITYTTARICHTAAYGCDQDRVAKPGKPWHIAYKRTMAKRIADSDWTRPDETISKDDMLKYTKLYSEIPSLAPCQPCQPYSTWVLVSRNGKACRTPNCKPVATPCMPK